MALNITKSDIIKIFVGLIVLGFIVQQYFIGGGLFLPTQPGGTSETAKNISGSVEFNGTLRNYMRVLAIPANASQTVITSLNDLEGVKTVNPQNAYI